jgi:hypothetical protein
LHITCKHKSFFYLNIEIGKDTIKGKSVGSNKWELWLGSKKFSINSPNATEDAVEIISRESTITLRGKQLHPNIWTTEHSFYGSSAWGSVSIWYTFEFNTESMKALIKSEIDVSA